MSNNRLFGNDIDHACVICQRGRPAPDQVMVLCDKHGPVAPNYKCRRFIYDPLKRTPKRPLPLPTFNHEDFEL